ncbi:MAG: hypothetical protein NTZ01_08400 [Verrucomicrobia bacterium]|nr:hypothetical protein [Verrucomicrobiota bacterium]
MFLILAVAAGLHILGLKVGLSLDQVNRRKLVRVTDELAEAKSWIEQKEQWAPKIGWLEKNLQLAPEENPAPALQKKAQSAAAAAGLKIEDQNLQAAKSGASCTIYGNRMRLTGSLEQFTKWITQLYQPETGVTVTALSLKLSSEPPKMTGEAEVGQFFRVKKQ